MKKIKINAINGMPYLTTFEVDENFTASIGMTVIDNTYRDSICPDCKEKPEKIKIRPCPRCGSEDIKVFDVINGQGEKYHWLQCQSCHEENNGKGWTFKSYVRFTDITSQIEVEP